MATITTQEPYTLSGKWTKFEDIIAELGSVFDPNLQYVWDNKTDYPIDYYNSDEKPAEDIEGFLTLFTKKVYYVKSDGDLYIRTNSREIFEGRLAKLSIESSIIKEE